jgi:hypothetical protein
MATAMAAVVVAVTVMTAVVMMKMVAAKKVAEKAAVAPVATEAVRVIPRPNHRIWTIFIMLTMMMTMKEIA